MKISLIVEGRTEQSFKPSLLEFLKGRRLAGMPKLDFFPCHGRVYKGDKLRRTVESLLSKGAAPSEAVIALTDVYTGAVRDFDSATDARRKMQDWVGNNARFYPHAAQHEFEAWLLPYWTDIQKLAGHNKTAPSGPPENVNHQRPPSFHISEIFRLGGKREYSKVRDAGKILSGKDLTIAAHQCSELKALLNTILRLSGGEPL